MNHHQFVGRGSRLGTQSFVLRICLTWATFSTRLFIMLTPLAEQEATISAHRAHAVYSTPNSAGRSFVITF